MQMGAPNNIADRATFRWVAAKTYATPDPAGKPYNWHTPPAAIAAIADLQLTCSVETPGAAREEGTPLGEFDASKAIVTLLDTEYDQLIAHGGRKPDQVLVGGTTYIVDYEGDPQGLFDVDMHQLHCTAQEQRA